MCEDISDNPFAGLFSSVSVALSFASQNSLVLEDKKDAAGHVSALSDEKDRTPDAKDPRPEEEEEEVDAEAQVNHLLKHVFGIASSRVCGSKARERLVLIETDSPEQALFERLLLQSPEGKLTPIENNEAIDCDPHTTEPNVVHYLFRSYGRLKRYRGQCRSSDAFERIRRAILQNMVTALTEPEVFQEQGIHDQFIELFDDATIASAELASFVADVVGEIAESESDPKDAIARAFAPILNILWKEAMLGNLAFPNYWFAVLQTFAALEPLAMLILLHSTPTINIGRGYANTLLGTLFSLSCLPKQEGGPFDYFDKLQQQSNVVVENNIWTALDLLNESLYQVFHILLKCSLEVRHMTLKWIGDCLHANAGRGKLSNSQNEASFRGPQCVSDGFMLNMGNVLLRLCQPFCVKRTNGKVPKIDPTYCAAEPADEAESERRGLHLKGMSSETCLMPTREEMSRPVAETFGFTTECFFLTHRALDLGYRVVLDKFSRTNQDMATMQRLLRETYAGNGTEAEEAITSHMERDITKFLSLKASLLGPQMSKLAAQFHATTAFWLVQVYLDHGITEHADRSDYTPRECKDFTFPLPEFVPDTLRCIPEFVVENGVRFLCFLRQYSPSTFEEEGPEFLNPILTEILVLTETQTRLYNPHLRARLAKGLEALLPVADENVHPAAARNVATYHREQLFITHLHRDQLVLNLLQVFVSIEMTGQSVQFEQKFNYRGPMYVVMEYLWGLTEHRNNFICLAQDAEANMEARQPPLFLRFVNLLMNDAVYLLDEALSNMAQLRQMLRSRENGEWTSLTNDERNSQTTHLQYISMFARFDNILGRKTIETLKMLTSEIKSIFCHPTIVNRIANMLNYLLLQLVGPNKKNLKVQDQKEYAFNPANLVLNICEIYINLSKNEAFTLAVSQDGRSYRPELFKLADSVLVRIGGVGILRDLDQFAKRVTAAANQKRKEDENLGDAPEEFLDPIMSTLMTDPVILPSSRITIDRQTIARHLLSDQTDPFNRSPLTMDMIKSDDELQRKIQEWINRKKEEAATSSQEDM